MVSVHNHGGKFAVCILLLTTAKEKGHYANVLADGMYIYIYIYLYIYNLYM